MVWRHRAIRWLSIHGVQGHRCTSPTSRRIFFLTDFMGLFRIESKWCLSSAGTENFEGTEKKKKNLHSQQLSWKPQMDVFGGWFFFCSTDQFQVPFQLFVRFGVVFFGSPVPREFLPTAGSKMVRNLGLTKGPFWNAKAENGSINPQRCLVTLPKIYQNAPEKRPEPKRKIWVSGRILQVEFLDRLIF